MALFSKADLPKSKYIISIVAKIKKGTKIKVKDGLIKVLLFSDLNQITFINIRLEDEGENK